MNLEQLLADVAAKLGQLDESIDTLIREVSEQGYGIDELYDAAGDNESLQAAVDYVADLAVGQAVEEELEQQQREWTNRGLELMAEDIFDDEEEV